MSGFHTVSRNRVLRRSISAAFAVLLALTCGTSVVAALTITEVTVEPEPHQLVIDFASDKEASVEITSFTLADPPRLVFDLPGTQLNLDLPDTIAVDAYGIQQIRLGQFEPEIARIVLDLSEADSLPVWELDESEDSNRIRIRVRPPGATVLGRHSIEQVEGAVLVRFPGGSQAPRSPGILDDPFRVFVDLTNVVVAEHYEQKSDVDPVREVRMGQQEAIDDLPVARIVVELADRQAFTTFSQGEDLVIAFGPNVWQLPLPEYASANRLTDRTIVIDPGHGGKDIGAPAIFGPPPEGPYEKDIVLDIGMRLARLLEAEGATVRMTRDDDTYVALQERAAMANRLKADALVSIHCNSCDSPNTLCGTSVYYDHSHSLEFASLVQRQLIASLGTEDKGVRNANFAVIRRANVPGILVETAFINHDRDRERLIHPNFRERAARAILRGLIEYLDRDANSGVSK